MDKGSALLKILFQVIKWPLLLDLKKKSGVCRVEAIGLAMPKDVLALTLCSQCSHNLDT